MNFRKHLQRFAIVSTAGLPEYYQQYSITFTFMVLFDMAILPWIILLTECQGDGAELGSYGAISTFHVMKGDFMVSSVISVLFGVISLLGPIPVLLPVIGLGLGANGFIKEGKKEEQKNSVKVTATIGIICCGLSVVIFFTGRLLP